MSNSGDILLRGGALLKKYQHYLPDEEMAPLGPKGGDQYGSLLYSMKSTLRDIQEKAESIKEELGKMPAEQLCAPPSPHSRCASAP